MPSESGRAYRRFRVPEYGRIGNYPAIPRETNTWSILHLQSRSIQKWSILTPQATHGR